MRRSTKLRRFAYLVVVASSAAAAGAQPGDTLGELLTRLDRTTVLYSQAALGFSCDETIRWEGKKDNGQRKFGYVVAVDDRGVFEDYRTLARKRKKSVPKRIDRLRRESPQGEGLQGLRLSRDIDEVGDAAGRYPAASYVRPARSAALRTARRVLNRRI